MAKQKAPSNNTGTTSVNTNTFIKGMNKDITQSMLPGESWWNARNAAINSTDGDLGVIGNEPSNLQCGVVPYTIIGAIHRYGDEWIVFSTDDINSEIGRFDDSECKYTTLVNDRCLNFNRKYLITGASKENFDCTWQVYWDDATNPSRTLNIDDIPWKQEITSVPYDPILNTGDPCIIYEDILPRTLNCEKIRLAPLVDTPCIQLTKSIDGGMLQNGSYQAYIAYTENEQKVTDYIGISNIQTIWSHQGTGGSLNISISNLDKDFENFELVLLARNQGQTYAKRIGLYSTERKDINIDYIDDTLIAVDISIITLRSPAYEKSEAMYVVNDWLLRQGPTEQFDFNYQPIANNIVTNFVVNELSAEYYHLGGNKMGFLRDEQYAFFIRWVYNTGERSSSYHIPGRAPYPHILSTDPILQVYENLPITNVNALSPSGQDPLFKIFNTGALTAITITPGSELEPDGSEIIGRGIMGYWESTERYPTNKPEIWGDLCGKPIRHHKMPSEEGAGFGPNSPLHISNTAGDKINLLGVEFSNIGRPKNNDGSYITNVVGYEILRGDRGGAKSILAKGVFRNMRKYTIPDNEGNVTTTTQGLYANYPYNDLRPDLYFHDGTNTVNDIHRTEGCNGFSTSISNFPPLGAANGTVDEPSGYSKRILSFSSPDLMFTKPFLNAYETRIYSDIIGESTGAFKPSEDHPQFKLLRNNAAIVSSILGIGYAIGRVNGERTSIQDPGKAYMGVPVDMEIETDVGSLNDSVVWYEGGSGSSSISSTGDDITGLTFADPDKEGFATEAYKNGADAVNSTMNDAYNLGYNPAYPVAVIGDLFSGGVSTAIAANILNGVAKAQGAELGGMPGSRSMQITKNTDLSNIPDVMKAIFTTLTTGTNITIGGNEIIDLIYNLIKKSDFVYKYNSYGEYNTYEKRNTGLWRIKNTDSNYLGSSFQSFNEGEYKINNLFRPSTVVVGLRQGISEPSVSDVSRFAIGGRVDADGTPINYDNKYLINPQTSQTRPISAYYGALKFNFDNQYGQLEGIKQIPMRSCINLLDPELPEAFMYSTPPIFAGDVFITRYTEKVIMPIFAQYLYGQPDEFTYDYSNHVNIPYPRFWLDSQRFDMSILGNAIASLGLSLIGGGGLGALSPNDLFYLDRGENSCGATSLTTVFGPASNQNDPNPIFAMRYAYMYSHINGILDFFVESEINLANRDWEDEKAKRIYSVYDYNDLTELFHAQIQKIDNYYKYDESLSPSKFPSQLSSWGQVQARYYDPYVAENCYVSRPKRLIYSLQAQHESKKDFWKVFLNFNYKDFKSKVNVIKPINKNGAIVFFPYLSPQMFQGLDTLKLGSDNNITIGDGRLFSQPFQNIANSDLSNEYGSCESLRGVINTPNGLYYISQAQGKIFHYGGKGLDPISNNGMKWWFNKYLPSQLIKQFPELEGTVLADNPVVGIGCQTIYDPNDDTVYFMKKDYKVKSEFNTSVTYNSNTGFSFGFLSITLGDPIYFDDASWTISYDPKSKAWISFHDWHPELALPSINHFFTTKTSRSHFPQCPPGYSFNSISGLCQITVDGSTTSTPPNYDVGSFWRHNYRCDSFANFYSQRYPWEVELVANTGQAVNTLRSIEYQLEVYVYKGDLHDACGDDKWEDLDFNFDRSVIYNNEQVSGLLTLVPTPFNNPILELTYPIITTNNINILCSKVEQKYRFNQFWDITNDRGEFTNAQQPIWDTELNGYIKNLNPINLNYFKSPLQHKKFRNYFTNVILRRNSSSDRKMLLRLNNTKLLTSLR